MKTYLFLNNYFKSLVLLLFCIGCHPEEETTIITESENKPYSPDYYDFSTEKKINDLGDFKFTPYENEIIFNNEYGNIEAPLRYYNNFDTFNFNGIYRVEDRNGKAYYFRFGWMKFENNETIFSNVRWLKKEPPRNELIYNISTVNMDFIQKGNISVSTIGDSQTWWQESQRLRRKMDHYFEGLIFVGSNTDIYGYGHEGEGGNETKEVLDRFHLIPEADYYTVLLGTNDYKRSNEGAFQNIISIFQKLTDKFPDSKIIYISPLPSNEESRNEFNEELQSKILARIIDSPNIIYLDVEKEIKNNSNWLIDYMDPDGLHLTSQGVNLLAEKAANTIRTDVEISE